MKSVAGVIGIITAGAAHAVSSSAETTSAGIHFLAIGDWGGWETEPYSMPAQVATAAGMAKVAKEHDSLFVLALGDNMYDHGIPDSSDATDFRFQKSFEEVYSQPELQIPWYVIAGNHDWKGNVQAQLDYSALSTRWNFPDYKHAHKFSWQEGERSLQVEVLMIDTVHLSGMGPDVPPHHPLYFSPPTGPLNATLASETFSWLEEHMAASTADYLWVAGHYPVYSACPHGGTQSLLDNLKPLLIQYEGHYMCGHDHCQMHIRDAEHLTNYVLTGSGEELAYEQDPDSEVPRGWLKFLLAEDVNPTQATAGFTSFSASSEKMTVTIHDQDGGELYSFDMAPRGRSARGGQK